MKNKTKIITAALTLACAVNLFTGCIPGFHETQNESANEQAGEQDNTAAAEATRYTHTEEATIYDIGDTESDAKNDSTGAVVESGSYTSMEEVSEYIHEFGHLPDNYITKSEAKKLGWKTNGNLSEVAPGKSIGGDSFGNREGLLPKQKGRKYFECDIDYIGGGRNAKRLIYSNDGLIYYTQDHYESFEQIY